MNQKIRELVEVAEMLKDPRVIPGDELDRLKEKATKYDLVLSWFDTNVEVFDDTYLVIGDPELTALGMILSQDTHAKRMEEKT